MFELHPRLAEDTVFVTDLKLCRVLLMNDQTYPWLILVPLLPSITEIHHLDSVDQLLLIEEISNTSTLLEKQFKPDNINVGALGNIVRQLHIHVIGRYRDDPVWPKPVWGATQSKPYPAETLASVVAHLKKNFEQDL